MIVGDNFDFFIQFDILCANDRFRMGPLNLWINGKAYPGKGALITLNNDIWALIDNFDRALKHNFKQSNLPLSAIDFLHEEIHQTNLMYWSTCELWDNGLSLFCEIVGDTLRLFYSLDNSPYDLLEIPLTYFQKIRDELFKILTNEF